MKEIKIKEIIAESIKTKQLLSFFRHFGGIRIHGCVLDFSDDFVLIHQTDDFQLDGYAILPIKSLKKVRHIQFEEFYDSVMQKEGTFDELGINYKIELSSWQAVFNSIIQQDKFAIIECEDLPFKRFLLGKIMKAKKKKVEMFYLEADGVFEESITEQKYKDITIVRFDERYTNLFQKYAKNIP